MVLGITSVPWISRLQTLQVWLLIAYAVSLPLTMTGSWVLLTACLIAWGLEAALKLRAAGKPVPDSVPAPMPLGLPLLFLAAAVALSGITHPGSQGPFAEGLRCVWSLKAIVVYFFACKVFCERPQSAHLAVQALLCVSAVAGIWGTIQQLANFHPFGYRYLQGTGFLSGPMPYAGQMQIFGLLSLGLFLTGGYKHFFKPLSHKYVFAAITLSNLLGLLFAGERSAWLGGLAGAFVLSALLSRKLFFKTSMTIVALSVVCWFTVPIVHNRIEAMFTAKSDVGTQVRLRIWSTSLDVWRSSPIFGVGFMSFPRMDIPEAIVPGVSKDLNHAHSNYLQILSTTGLVGACAYIWLCLVILATAVRTFSNCRKKGDSLTAGFSAGGLAAMVSLMISGLFEFNFGTAQVRLAQWLVLGLLSCPPARQADSTTVDRTDKTY